MSAADADGSAAGPSGAAAASSGQRCLTLTGGDRATAATLAGLLSALADPPPMAVSFYEHDGGWRVDAYFERGADTAPGDEAAYIAALRDLADLGDSAGVEAGFSDVADANWVALSQEALPPVEIGRFVIHGTHDRARFAGQLRAIEIDAGEAFGTAHHATTYGCLGALDQLGHRLGPHRILDLGTGSGVLAIAARRIWPEAAITASDIDADAVRVAADNLAKNRAANVRVVAGDGLTQQHGGGRGAFDLIIANILAGPLIALSGSVARATRARGVIVLSGILNHQAAAVRAAYRAHGLSCIAHRRESGWSVLTLTKRSQRAQRPMPSVGDDL
ncbi:MAG: 50S ribosomal protein L11 methyltransferase [Pseudomonadota bacterium]